MPSVLAAVLLAVAAGCGEGGRARSDVLYGILPATDRVVPTAKLQRFGMNVN